MSTSSSARLAFRDAGARPEPGDAARGLGGDPPLEGGLGEVGALPQEVPRVLGQHRWGFHGEVRVHLGAQALDQLDLHLDAVVRWRVEPGRIREALGPDAEHHPSADPLADARSCVEQLGRQRQLLGAEANPDRVPLLLQLGLDQVHRRRPDEPAHEEVHRLVVEHLRCVDLLEQTALQDGHTIAHGHRLGLVVRDVDGGCLELALDAGDLGAHLHPQLGVEVRQRFVHEEHRRRADDGATHRDALPLTTREVAWLAVEQLLETEDVRDLFDSAVAFCLRHLVELQAESEVVAHREVRVERVVLEHHRDVAVLGGNPVHDALRRCGPHRR